MTTTKKIFSIATTLFAGLFTVALPLVTTTTLTACGKDNTAGTDEQANSVTAQVDTVALDSALAEWTVTKTFVVPVSSDTPAAQQQHFIISDLTQVPGIEVENGTLYNKVLDHFEALSCENDSNWFVYSVSVSDSLIHKYLNLPDSVSVEPFETDCIAEGGTLTEEETVVARQRNFTCELRSPVNEDSPESVQYTDPNWEKYVKLIVGICRD
jgi:hypothetical protein